MSRHGMTRPELARPAITRAGPLHAEALSAIHARAFPQAECWDTRIIAGQLSQPGVFGLMAIRGGMILARLAADEAEVLTVAVVPERRQQGLGARLVSAAAAEARARGAARMFLEVSTQNPAARGLYQRLGFTQVGRRASYYADGSDALVLAKKLTGA
jgi:ribosomal-protein-alanine N-acetyltransferase